VSWLTGLFGWESDCKGSPAGGSTLFGIPYMATPRNISRTLILVFGDVDTAFARHGEIETETLCVDFHSKEIQPFTPGSKIIGLFGSVEFGLFRMEKAIEDVGLILFCNANPVIGNVKHNLPILLFDPQANHSFIRRIFHCIPEEALYNILKDEGIDEDEKIIFSLHPESNISVAR
jgi:hypothetical protein